MEFKIDQAQVKILGEDLSKAGVKTAMAGLRVLQKTALDIQRTAMALSPVRTGALRNSITQNVSGSITAGTISAEIGPTVHYGKFVEEGTSRMAPQPYMRPAVDLHEPAFLAAIATLSRGVL